MKTLANYKGLVREVYIYLTFPARKKIKPIRKFVIFGLPRSGSTLLVNLLDSHPNIFCEGEILLKRVLFPKTYLKFRMNLSRKEVYGFKLLVSHFHHQQINNPFEFVSYLCGEGYKILCLKRRNILLATISLMYAISRDIYHHRLDEGEVRRDKIHLDPLELIKKLEWMETLVELQEHIMNKLPNLDIVYEDNLEQFENHQPTVNLICDYLEIPRAKTNTDLIKIGSMDVSTYIINSEEIFSYLRESKYDYYL